ncbi:hypothetical protein A2625_06690 [candidate division WOR-1 bacterium RIFCSPHIGHO2_01_FULL_53_15]|uniref:Uncharacterized protein n=1 Tax=candidate division WOR-1 bacterium RIFCSPHIGHO2_01_FULL_53_15 TaxID=1802564 RepID=A0A1F4Q4L4_UNCSA|nr:MAG: hypothetical protein A2625_06690 [candidate division WOR-1 bacterium RIFCSPHIGHO2_01_FULL_53_15]OGC10291.1 MAG: hypothetical protein A3D23_06695 [candidate division WOR-1 bacterium RIFCSPHIGHO2_02_FULL_53_26]
MAWQIKYSNHLKERVKTRKLPFGLARDILIFAIERYHDTMTHYLVAIGAGEYEGKTREFAVTYKEDWQRKIVEAITIHPLKQKQRENRIKSGRWLLK